VIVRINSPGNDGPITQNNITVASSTAANNASTAQSGVESLASMTTQQATPTATATQDAAGNLVITVRQDSPGKTGAITQANTVLGASNAINSSTTTQQAAAPNPAVQPQARGAGAAVSRKPPRPQDRQPAATVRAPAESSQPPVATTDPEPTAAAPQSAAIQKQAPTHRHSVAAQTSRVRTHHLPTLSGIASGAARVLSPLVPHTSPVVTEAGQSQDISRPVLLALLLSAAAAATFALVRRAPARRRAGARRTPR